MIMMKLKEQLNGLNIYFNMTNEEKAKSLVGCPIDVSINKWNGEEYNKLGFEYAMEMAKWKDQQFKDILKQKFAAYHKKYETSIEPDEQLLWGGKEDAIELLLLELFREDNIDYSDRDE